MKIFHDSRNRSACRSCGAVVEWAETTTGARTPFNPPIVTVPVLVPVIIGGRVVEDVDPATVSHFATCPDAKEWRRRRGMDHEA
jgi:hypothetical protein